MQPVLVALGDGGDANHVLAAIEQTRVDKNRARSFRTGVDHESVHGAQALTPNSEHRCAEFDLHSGPSRIVGRDALPGFSDWYPALARIWHVECLIAYPIDSTRVGWEETARRGRAFSYVQ